MRILLWFADTDPVGIEESFHVNRAIATSVWAVMELDPHAGRALDLLS